MIKPVLQNDQIYSEIYELEGRFLSKERPLKIIKRSCEYFGSDYEGRRKGTKQLINITHKAPIMIDPITSIYFFPTTSPNQLNCIWIAHEHVLSHRPGENNSTIVTFQNNTEHTLPLSARSFGTQLSRTSNLRIRYEQNVKRMEMYMKPFHTHSHFQASEFQHFYRIFKP